MQPARFRCCCTLWHRITNTTNNNVVVAQHQLVATPTSSSTTTPRRRPTRRIPARSRTHPNAFVAAPPQVALKRAAQLGDDDVAAALRERAQRIYDSYGTLMLNTEGMSAGGVERKATCQNLFRKLLYLTEFPMLLDQGADPRVHACE